MFLSLIVRVYGAHRLPSVGIPMSGVISVDERLGEEAGDLIDPENESLSEGEFPQAKHVR
jgi:hypothetical protein